MSEETPEEAKEVIQNLPKHAGWWKREIAKRALYTAEKRALAKTKQQEEKEDGSDGGNDGGSSGAAPIKRPK